MKQADAEKLLGGYATGTLTEEERTTLFAAALEQQALFDALLDEEALRELLADPAARAQLLSALSAQAPKGVPFWRRTSILGAAASLMVATLAGLAYWRTPVDLRTATQQEAAKTAPAPAPNPAPVLSSEASPRATKAQPGAPSQAPTPQLALRTPAPAKAKGGAEEQSVPRADGPTPAPRSAALKRWPEAQLAPAAADLAGAMASEAAGAPAPQRDFQAKAEHRLEAPVAKRDAPPRWALKPLPGGLTQVTVQARREARLVLLQRGRDGVQVVPLQKVDEAAEVIPWRAQVRLAPDDILDLYQLDEAVADPARLPEAGPVAGFRIRIHPAP